MSGGFSLELDMAGSARLWHAGWRADPASAKVVLGFVAPAGQGVDDCSAGLSTTGFPGRRPPSGGFWGARSAIVADLDGNDVGLMSSVRDWRRTWPPRQGPAP